MEISFSLPLRPLVEKGDKKDTLPIRIAQINAQRGFRNITEQSLQEEIDAQRERGEAGDEEDVEKKPADLDATERHDLLYKRRAEIANFAMQAHTEALFALDFISLALTKHNQALAEVSISPLLKRNVPSGSLELDVIKTPERSASAEHDKWTVARGWKLESFNTVANKLLKAATRLESEAATEAKYWDEVLAVKEKGWKVCRLPRERQVLGVQFGFLEATPTFRDRGLASLLRADDGTLVLDRGLALSPPRAVRVRVRKDNQITGCSKLSRFVAVGDHTIEIRILQSRDTLYEEELFHELTREARILANSGVITRHNLIEFEYNEGEDILLDLVDIDDFSDGTDSTHRTHEHDTLAEAAAYSLRILLSYAHRQNLKRRSQFPPPLTTMKRHHPEYQLLRPILSYLQHRSHVQSLQSFLRDVYQVLKSAGIKTEFTASLYTALNTSRKLDGSTVDSLVSKFLQPLQSTFSGTMVHPTSTFTIKVHTNLSGPSLGTHYVFSIRLPNFPYTQPPSHIGLKEEVESLLLHLITLDLTTLISSISSTHAATVNPKSSSKPLVFEAPFVHYGELVASSTSSTQTKKLSVHLTRTELSLRTSWRGGEYATAQGDEVNEHDRVSDLLYSWTLNDSDSTQPGKKKTLEEVIIVASKNDEIQSGRS